MSKNKKPIQKPVQKKSVFSSMNGMQQATIAIVIVAVIAIVWVILIGVGRDASQKSAAAESTAQAALVAATSDTVASQTGSKQYSAAPTMSIDVKKQYFATFKMARGGEFVIQLYPDKAPITVNNFVFLANEGFYNGTTFHRVLEGFMAQGGDPTGTGMGGPGYQFQNEVSDLNFDKPGVVAMANAGPNTNGSQFFIMFAAYGLSPNDYTIFGQVVSGMDVVNAITRRDPQANPTFSGDAISTVTITEK